MGSTRRPMPKNCVSRQGNGWLYLHPWFFLSFPFHCPTFFMNAISWSLATPLLNFWCTACTIRSLSHAVVFYPNWDHVYILICRQGRCRRVAGNQDGSKGTAKMEHSATLEVTGRQGSRGNGMGATTFLVTYLAAQSCNHPLSTLAQVYRD